ncbi:MAG: hypothetical protein V1847_01800 [Candidatus Diapherotrites archaeon]
MRARGFTLFTALVSFVLIGLAFLLVQAMMSTERATTDTISLIDEQTELQSIADLSRADAIQVFNFSIRYNIEVFLNLDSAFYQITPERAGGEFQEIVDDFAQAEFGDAQNNRKFATRMAGHLVKLLAPSKEFKGYVVSLDNQNEEKLRETLVKIVGNSVSKEKFLQPVKCDEFDCEIGTFYANLDLTTLSDEEYESLPQISVTSSATGRTIKQPILPKGNIRVYVPLRVFKALHVAKGIAARSVFNDGGTFQGRVKEVALGMCEASGCGARENPFQSAFQNGYSGKLCPFDPRDYFSNDRLNSVPFSSDAQTLAGASDYNPNNVTDMGNKLDNIVETLFCNSIEQYGLSAYDAHDNLLLSDTECTGIERVSISPYPFQTKTIETKGSQSGSSASAQCIKVSDVSAILKFTEEDPLYSVGSASPGKNAYKVELVQNVTKSATIQGINWGKCESNAKAIGIGISPESAHEFSCQPV